jgi:hypothetical protein
VTTLPHVELAFGPVALDTATTSYLTRSRAERGVEEALVSALVGWREHLISETREELKRYATMDGLTLTKVVDKIWGSYTPRFSSLMIPYLMNTYAKAFGQANAGKVPSEYLEMLAKEYALRLGNYYHDTSREALVQGFQTYVNRKMARKAAADRALMAYGLTPRQMSGLTSAVQFDSRVDSPTNVLATQKASRYIRESATTRIAGIAAQENHNLEQQAQQTVWMWLTRHGKISKNATKVWLTAKDERVCPLCGPLHGMKVPLVEKFPVGTGALWTPGVHPNCRCEVRLTQRLELVEKADKWYEDEIPRTSDGRFARARAKLDERAAQRQTTFKPLPGGDVIETTPVESEPVIETTEEPRFSAPPAAPKFGASSSPTFGQQPKFSAPPGTEVKFKGLPSAESRSDVVFGASKEKRELSFSVPEKAKLQLGADFSQLFTRLKLTPPPESVEQKVRRRGKHIKYSPTIKILDDQGNPTPAFAVVPGVAMTHHDHIDITEDEGFYFTTSEEDAAQQAIDVFDANIEDVADYIEQSRESKIVSYANDGTQLYAQIDPQDVYDIVSTVAYQLADEQGDWNGENATVEVTWRNDMGDEIGKETIKYSQIIEDWGLDPEMFEVAVVRMTEGHDSSLGSTEQVQAGTSYANEGWVTSGRYTAHMRTASDLISGVPVTMYDITPDVELYDVPPELLDWREEGR